MILYQHKVYTKQGLNKILQAMDLLLAQHLK